jgi:tRNA wybutosine-synthesizing protein 3
MINPKSNIKVNKNASRFDREKKDVMKKLASIDKSRKGSVDADIRDLIDRINAHPDYYTTSSCSGRIMLIDKGPGRKDLAKWLLASHSTITKKDFDSVFTEKYLASEDFKKSVIWFMEEPAIMHVCTRDFESAQKLLNLVHGVPFKRSGIISCSRRIIIEILDTEKMETLVARKGKMFVNDEYGKVLVNEANSKLKKTKAKLKKFYNEFKKI